jgi:hypothetical protein
VGGEPCPQRGDEGTKRKKASPSANLERDWGINQLSSVVPPCTGNFRIKGDENFSHVNGTNSPIQDFAGPVEFGGHRG